MPFKSKAQQRWMFAAEERGEVPKGTAERWVEHAKNMRNLPEKKANLAGLSDEELGTHIPGYRHSPETKEILRDYKGQTTPIGSTADIGYPFHYPMIGALAGGLPPAIGAAVTHSPLLIPGALVGAAAGGYLGHVLGKNKKMNDIERRYDDTVIPADNALIDNMTKDEHQQFMEALHEADRRSHIGLPKLYAMEGKQAALATLGIKSAGLIYMAGAKAGKGLSRAARGAAKATAAAAPAAAPEASGLMNIIKAHPYGTALGAGGIGLGAYNLMSPPEPQGY